jgi:tripartite-type tricarboxylate transporter receptor subunit TctC
MLTVRLSRAIVAPFLFASSLLPGQVMAAGEAGGRAVRIVTSEAGGGADIAARAMGQMLAAEQGRAYVVDNRGGGVIAPEIVAKAPSDGQTLLFYGNTVWLMPLMRAHMNYDPQKDLVPISLAIVSPTILVVNAGLPVRTVKELVALAKAKPGQLNYGSAATGTGNHLAAELFKYMAGVDIVRVAYKGGPALLVATISGETQLAFPASAPALQAVKSGKVRALAVTSAKPSSLAPDLPTLASAAGLPGYESMYRAGLFAPGGTSPVIVNQISHDAARALQRSDLREKLFAQGVEVVGSTPEEFATAIRSELSVMGKVIKQAGIRDE